MIPAVAFAALLSISSYAEAPSALSELRLLAGPDIVPIHVAGWNIPKEVFGEHIDGVLIVGDREFIEATRSALAIVKRSSLKEEVLGAIGRIEQAPCSGVDPNARRTTFHVGEPTWRADSLWYAGAIAHDARHAQLYREAKKREPALEPKPDDWKNARGERIALAYQIRFLRELKASPQRLAYLASLQAEPTYHLPAAPTPAVEFDRSRPARYSLVCRGRDW